MFSGETRLNLFLKKIDDCLREYGAFVLALDGQSGSGKSALGDWLVAKYDASLVRMDDFFPQELLRFSVDATPFDIDRFKKEVINPLRKKCDFSYRIFDCRIDDFSGERSVPFRNLRIVEGSYALHPELGRYYDLSLYLTCNMKERLNRLRARTGGNDELFRRFKTVWIPREEAYRKAYRVDQNADFLVDLT